MFNIIALKNAKPGDILEFKGKGFTFRTLSFLLCISDKSWRKRKWKPWHLAILWRRFGKGWLIMEARREGVQINFYKKEELETRCRVHRWLDRAPSPQLLDSFEKKHLSQKYDILVYFWTAVAYLIRHYWGRPIPRLFDQAWSCWELVYYFCDRMGKPLAEDYDFPMITDFLKIMEAKQ